LEFVVADLGKGNSSRKRRVNPALLLGGASNNESGQPELVESDSFSDRRKPVNNFRSSSFVKDDVVEEEDSGPSLLAADDDVVEGAADLPQQSNPAGDKNVVKKVTVPQPVKKDIAFPSLPSSKKDDVEGRRDVVEPRKVSVSRPVLVDKVPAKNVFGGDKSVAKSSSKDNTIASSDVTENNDAEDKPKRKVNPLFLAGEERETVPAKTATPVPRPSFFLDSDKVPARRPVDFSKNKAEVLGEVEDKVIEKLQLEDKPFANKVAPKPRSQYSRKIEANLDAGEWEEEDEGTHFGLGGEVDADYVEPQYSKAFHLTERDIIIMRFLARYRYAYVDQIARLVDSTPRTIVARMRVLEKRGFLRKEPITDKQYLWTTRKAGNVLADISFPEIKKGSISYATIAHTIGLGNLGVEFEREAGGKDLLGEGKGVENWVPPENRWRLGIWFNPDGKGPGEMTVTEREIRQGQLRWRGGRSTKEMRELVSAAASSRDSAPELEEGNEGLFVVYGAGGKGGEHIPDLVVARERDNEGKPQHIAVELELTPKSNADWRKILRNYRDNGEMYSKIYYFTHKRSISTALIKLAEAEGISDRFIVRKYTPVNGRMPFWG
jgi:predicted DNA-binding transcriptional regulator